MGLSRESPYKLIKGVSPSWSMKKKMNISTTRSSSIGNIGNARGRAVHKHESEVVGADDDQLENAKLANESDCLWLSSDCKSPSFSFDYHISWDVCELESNYSSLDKLYSLLLSKNSDLSLNKRSRFFDGSIVSPIEEASLVLERTSKEKEGVHQVSFSQSFSSLIGDLDEAGVQVSLLDLDREDSEWISDEVPGLDFLQSDFPSPSYKINWNSKVGFANQGGEVDTDEPLFWPLQRKLDWNAEIAWDFCISPRKSGRKIGSCERSQTRRSSNGSRLNERKMNLKEGLCKRNLVFNSISKVETSMECKIRDGKKNIRRSNTMPARLRKMTPNMKHMKEETISDKAQTETLMEDFKFLDRVFLSINDELSIETLIGLNEFDGHEGVDSEFNKDQFLLDE
ncbi:uncharacterized protein LOC122655277 [Telopea speciosissima]|uniref:uncharacterized protein LOC122655277 n=1 Tax=Telopea speciosissima TaxID=54955 RepID=UPI001CC80D08|nr:uncharacterized protein LOC122655277 [Telopea speciosissima]